MATHEKKTDGLAMVAVLLVLLALLVLCTPFLLTVGNTDKASSSIVDDARAELALETAARHARSKLRETHPAIDATPNADSQAEIEVSNQFDPEFLDARDPHGVMWDLDVHDVAGRIDINSAPPQLIGNLIGGIAQVLDTVEPDDTEIKVNTTEGFLPVGFFWAGRELIGYGVIEMGAFGELVRGLGVGYDEEGNVMPCGPIPPRGMGLGLSLHDQRCFAIAEWRLSGPGHTFRTFDAIEQVSNAQTFVMVETLGEDALALLARTTTPYAELGADARWQNWVRVLRNIEGGQLECRIQVADGRYFNKGTTVQISDGQTTEIGLVYAANDHSIELWNPLVNEYYAYDTVVRPLSRRPVNINTASREVLEALLANLRLRDKNARITRSEARVLAEAILVSRPFIGFEDFVRRIVLPAGGIERLPKDAPVVPDVFLSHMIDEDEEGAQATPILGFIDEDDARALYKNALNANDNELVFSTMPFSFVTRDVYEYQLRASVNAPSGVERTAAVREQVELVVPQSTLMQVWHRQSDFDLDPRFTRTAPGWITGPEVTTRWDPRYHSWHPSRSRSHLGPYDTWGSRDPLSDTPRLVFASHEDNSAELQLWAARMEITGDRNHVFHFDNESRSHEGRYLPDGSLAFNPGRVGWDGNLMPPVSFSAWIQPRALEDGARFLDFGGAFTDSDRVSLLFEESELVLRVLDGAGDNPDSAFEEVAEIRYPFGGEVGPGVDVDTWVHVGISVAGNRPDQMMMTVDGKWFAETPGLTRLTSSISAESGTIPVESTDGFPDTCVIRIGEELIEVVRDGDTTFSAQHQEQGEYAGFGGRIAREMFTLSPPGPPINTGAAKPSTASYPAGTAVQLYGYSLPVASNIPSASATLPTALGLFGVGRIAGIVKGGDKYGVQMEPIMLLTSMGDTLTIGWGMDGMPEGKSDVEGLILEPADPNGTPEDLMKGFSQTGGYAAILSLDWTVRVNATATDPQEETRTDIAGTRLGGIEVIYYSGYQGNQLMIQRRGDQVPELKNLAEADVNIKGRGSFIFEWAEWFDPPTGLGMNERLSRLTLIIPISLPITGGGGVSGFLPAQSGQSQFAQITQLGANTHLTEWVRYDEVTSGQLVRDDPSALRTARWAAHAGLDEDLAEGDRPLGGGGTGGTGGTGGSGHGGGGGGSKSLTGNAPPPPAPTSSPPMIGTYWDYDLGEEEDRDFVVSHATRTNFQFRGVFGTHVHEHEAGTVVLPVWQTRGGDMTTGWPGRLDWVTLFDDDPTLPGWPERIHFAHRPNQYAATYWREGAAALSADSAGEAAQIQNGMARGVTYVALQEPARAPIAAGSAMSDSTQQGTLDTRWWSRISMFPSGERPREMSGVRIGGDYRSARGGSVPSAVIDEIVMSGSRFGETSSYGEDTWGGQLVLAMPVSEGDSTLEVFNQTLRTPAGSYRFDQNFLDELPEKGGILRIGDELVFYDSTSPENDLIMIPENGRGLLGTIPQPHVRGEAIAFVPSIRATVLTSGMSEDDFSISVASIDDMPSTGTLLIEDELVHYDYVLGGSVVMARRSTVPGAMNGQGAGLFRGRYGTVPAAHSAGTPVIVFPFRYWDRWAERADAPEMHYLGMSASQPGAFWQGFFWDDENPRAAGPRLGVLLRTDATVPWDEDPDAVEELELLWRGMPNEQANVVGDQADRIEWRFFVGHDRGSFDPVSGLSNGWKMTPRVTRVGIEYLGPGRVLRRVAR